MEILKKVGITIILCLIAVLSNAQIGFYKKFTAGSFIQGKGIIELPDSSLVFTGTGGEFDKWSGQAYLASLDSLGNFQWLQHYGGQDSDEVGIRVMYQEGEGFYIAGYSSDTEEGDFDFMLIKTDLAGNKEWIKTYGTSNWEIVHDALLWGDKVILVGEQDGLTTEKKDIYLVCTDLDGDTLWTKTISTLGDDVAYGVDSISTSEIIVGGKIWDNGFDRGVLYSFSDMGVQNWQKFDYQNLIHFHKNIEIVDDKIFTSGGIFDGDTAKYDMFYAEYDLNGDFINILSGDFEFTNNTEVTAMANIPNAGRSLFIALAYEDLNSIYPTYPGGYDSHVHHFSRDFWYMGNSYNFSAYNDDFILEMIPTRDGGIAFVGTVGDNGKELSQGTRAVVGKIGPDFADPYVDEDHVEVLSILSIYENSQKNQTLSIYPNPTDDVIFIPSEVKGYHFSLTNIQGEQILSGQLEESLSMEKVSAGIYFLSVKDDLNTWSAKIIKQ